MFLINYICYFNSNQANYKTANVEHIFNGIEIFLN